jgi:hypothetical protein
VLLYAPHRKQPADHGIRLRLRVWSERERLDAALAAGVDPNADPALARRAHQLTGPSTRRAMAGTVRKLLDAAEEPPSAWAPEGPRPPVQRASILDARDELLALAERLDEPTDLSPKAAALFGLMAWDSGSPLYAPSPGSTVREWAGAILGASVSRAD